MHAGTLLAGVPLGYWPDRAVIRRACFADLDGLVPLCSSLRAARGLDECTPAAARAWLAERLHAWGSRLIVAEVGGEIVAYCAYDVGQARLLEIYVAEPVRGRAIGRDLLAFVEQDLARADVALLLVTLDQSDDDARAFFCGCGFTGAPAAAGRLEFKKTL
jgi:GNAT superfamily N-acetyltransferase